MNEEALFQEFSTNRALQATYGDFASYRDFMLSQMPAQANDNRGITGIVNNATSNMGSIKDLGKNLITSKLSSKMGLNISPIGIGGLILSGLSGINDRIRQTDFARSKNLMDYLDAKKYGGIDARNQAAAENMLAANVLQQEMAMRSSSNVSNQDAARGNIGSRSAPSAPAKSYSAPQQTSGAGGLHNY
jgi:hypothetical protein